MNRQPEDVQRELENLHQRWGRTNTMSYSENIKAQADNEAKATKKFIRIIQRKARADSKSNKRTRVPSGNHEVIVVAA